MTTEWQMGFFDRDERLAKLDKLGYILVDLKRIVDFEIFRPLLAGALEKKQNSTNGGRPALDPIFMFKILILQRLYNLSDERVEFQINDRLTFQRVLGLDINSPVPDYTSVWLFREKLTASGVIKQLFDLFTEKLSERGLIQKGGTIVDATFVEVPKQRNTREENEMIKEGKTPSEWEKKPQKLSHKDVDARWAKKNKATYYGYINHLLGDAPSKFMRDYIVTNASVHDSQCGSQLIGEKNEGENGFGDSAYKSAEMDAHLVSCKVNNFIHEKVRRGHPLSEKSKETNRKKSGVRCLVEHIFGCRENSMGGIFLKTIGIERARTGIGLMNLAYNMLRLVQLRRLGRAPNWPCPASA
ncbi:MAG: IS5 family transposase [Puniceicoccales bacterium]|jgi:IS5 family transposase|nr:IS5 family transposase [Puniceicoccales bacterium]